jgi:hypothetical protein
MPEIVSCPECERKLACPHEYVGRKVRCPGCSGMFKAAPDPDDDDIADVHPATRTAPDRDDRIGTAPAGRAPARLDRRRDEEEDEDHPRRPADEEDGRRPANYRQGWRMTRLGLMFVSLAGWTKIAYYLILLLGVSLLLLLMGAAMFSAFSSASAGEAPTGAAGAAVGGVLGLVVLIIVLMLIAFLETVVRLVGLGLCMMVPSKRGTGLKGLAIAAFAVSAFYILAYLAGQAFSGFSGFNPRNPAGALVGVGGRGLGLFSLLVHLAGYVLTLLFLRSAAVQVREESAAKQIVSLMIAWGVWGFACVAAVVLFVIGFGFTLFSAASSAGSGSATGAATSFGVFGFICIAAMGLISLLWAGLYIWYLMIIQKVRRAVLRHVAQTA